MVAALEEAALPAEESALVRKVAPAVAVEQAAQAKAMHADIEATLKLYESLPAGAALPKAATPDTPAPTPNP